MNVDGITGPVLNVSSFDFLSLSQNADIKQKAKDALNFYGCGSCGPRGFYGTIDQHLIFEDAVAKFLGSQVDLSSSLVIILLINELHRKQFVIRMVRLQFRLPFLRFAKRVICCWWMRRVPSRYSRGAIYPAALFSFSNTMTCKICAASSSRLLTTTSA